MGAVSAEVAVALAEGIRLVVGAPDWIAQGHVAVLLKMRERAFGRIDRDVREVWTAEPLNLRVEVGGHGDGLSPPERSDHQRRGSDPDPVGVHCHVLDHQSLQS